VGFWILSFSSSARRKNSARHADRAKSSVLRTRILQRQETLAKKKKTGEKRPRNCAMDGLDYTVTLASSMKNALSRCNTFSLPSFLPRFFSLTRVDPRRRAKPHKGNIADRASTASSPPQVSPSPRLPPASFFFTHPPPCSSRQPSSLSTHKFTQPLHPDRNESVFKNASLFNFIISVALIFPDLIYILQLDWSVISM